MAILHQIETIPSVQEALMVPVQTDPAYADMPSEGLDVILRAAYRSVAEQIWELNDKRTRQTFVGRVAGKLMGKQHVFLASVWDGETLGAPEVLLCTSPLLEKRATIDDTPVSVGWAFSVRGYLPDVMSGYGSVLGHLRPASDEVTVLRTARKGDTLQLEDYYTICNNEQKGAGVVRHRIRDERELVANLERHVSGISLPATYEARRLAAAQHALQLATEALPVLKNSY